MLCNLLTDVMQGGKASMCCITIIVCLSTNARGQDTEQKLQLLRQQYEATIKDFDQRISTMEEQIKNEKEIRERGLLDLKQGRVDTEQTTASGASTVHEARPNTLPPNSHEVGAKFQGQVPSEPSYDLLHEADHKIAELQEHEGVFEFHGYLRSGFGLNSQGANRYRLRRLGLKPSTA